MTVIFSKVKVVDILVIILKISKILVNLVNHPDFKKWVISRKVREIEQNGPKFRLPLALSYPRRKVMSIHKWNLVGPYTLGNFFEPRSTL